MKAQMAYESPGRTCPDSCGGKGMYFAMDHFASLRGLT